MLTIFGARAALPSLPWLYAGTDVKRKAGLLGLTFLLDFTVFERQGQDAA